MAKLKLSRFHRICLRLFQVFAFSAISIDSEVKRKRYCGRIRIIKVWCLTKAIIGGGALIAAEMVLLRFLPQFSNKVGSFYEYGRVALLFLAFEASAIESFMRRRNELQFWRLHAKLCETNSVDSTDTAPESKRSRFRCGWHKDYENFILKAAFSIFLSVITEYYFYVFYYDRRLWMTLLLEPFKKVLRVRHLQFIFYLDVLALELMALQRRLHLLVDYMEFAGERKVFPKFEDLMCDKLQQLQRDYDLCHEMLQQFLETSKLSIVWNVVRTYSELITIIYWCIFAINSGETMWCFIHVLVPITYLLFLADSSRHVAEAANSIRCGVHKLRRNAGKYYQLSIQIENFSLQTQHEHITVEIWGLFKFDYPIIKNIITSIITMVTFFIQLLPRIEITPIMDVSEFLPPLPVHRDQNGTVLNIADIITQKVAEEFFREILRHADRNRPVPGKYAEENKKKTDGNF